uniref:Uncharacterized protein n=1 Tax=Romanomermis culicivorax TaxID=13658 RepID=A0A915K2R1_ROMCU
MIETKGRITEGGVHICPRQDGCYAPAYVAQFRSALSLSQRINLASYPFPEPTNKFSPFRQCTVRYAGRSSRSGYCTGPAFAGLMRLRHFIFNTYTLILVVRAAERTNRTPKLQTLGCSCNYNSTFSSIFSGKGGGGRAWLMELSPGKPKPSPSLEG